MVNRVKRIGGRVRGADDYLGVEGNEALVPYHSYAEMMANYHSRIGAGRNICCHWQ